MFIPTVPHQKGLRGAEASLGDNWATMSITLAEMDAVITAPLVRVVPHIMKPPLYQVLTRVALANDAQLGTVLRTSLCKVHHFTHHSTQTKIRAVFTKTLSTQLGPTVATAFAGGGGC